MGEVDQDIYDTERGMAPDGRPYLKPELAWRNKEGNLLDGSTAYDVNVVHMWVDEEGRAMCSEQPREDRPRILRAPLEEANRYFEERGMIPLFGYQPPEVERRELVRRVLGLARKFRREPQANQ